MIELDLSLVLESCGEIIDCIERKDIVNCYKMLKYLVRFVIIF